MYKQNLFDFILLEGALRGMTASMASPPLGAQLSLLDEFSCLDSSPRSGVLLELQPLPKIHGKGFFLLQGTSEWTWWPFLNLRGGKENLPELC